MTPQKGVSRKKCLTVSILCFAAALIALYLLVGCAQSYREIGFREMQRGFAQIYQPSDLHEIVKLRNVTVHIVGDRKYFNWDYASAYGSPVQGYATRNNEIWVFGTVVKGRVVLNQAILGHEFNHLLEFNHPQVHNPDQLDDIGA